VTAKTVASQAVGRRDCSTARDLKFKIEDCWRHLIISLLWETQLVVYGILCAIFWCGLWKFY
jgi:hypothetical protein